MMYRFTTLRMVSTYSKNYNEKGLTIRLTPCYNGVSNKKGHRMNILQAKRMLREELDKHELYHVEVKLNNRLTSVFGRYRWNEWRNTRFVELSTQLVEINEEDRVRLTILHEVAHALTEGHGHDGVWKAKLLEIGGDGKRCYSSTNTNTIERTRSNKMYMLVCQDCLYSGGRYRRRMNGYSHRGCGGELRSVQI